ncbi:tetratricopeptide repeat protein [Desulfosoma caldarium]|nr:tetratricopeptide repeat protein [Desulfosoma caldarium]
MERERFSAGAPRSEKLSDFWVDALLYLAKSMITEGKKREALRCVVKLRCAELQDSPSLFRLADLYQDLGEHREALRLLARVDPQKRASSFFPTPPLTTTHVVSRTAFSLLVLGLREEALHCIESLPDQTLQKDVWQAVGLLAGDRGHDALVHEAFGRALRFGELTAKAWDQWGVAWKRAGKRHKAEVCWRKALLLDSDLESARIHLANMLWDVGRTAEAYEMFKSLVDNGCQKVPVLLAFAILAAERGHESALGRVREALEVWLQNNTASPHHDLTLREGIFGKLAHVLEREQKIHLAKIAQRLALRETSKPISRQTAAPSRAS